MKLATWNVNSVNVRLPQLLDWLAAARPDILCLQELKCEEAKFPRAALEAAGYAAAVSAQKTYNGVAILARGAPAAVVAGIPGFADEQKRVLAATVEGVRVMCVYCPNGQAVGSDKYDYKLRWFAALRDYLAAELVRHPRLAVAGANPGASPRAPGPRSRRQPDGDSARLGLHAGGRGHRTGEGTRSAPAGCHRERQGL